LHPSQVRRILALLALIILFVLNLSP